MYLVQMLNRTKKETTIFSCDTTFFDYWKLLLWARIEEQVSKELKIQLRSNYQKGQQFLGFEIYKHFIKKLSVLLL